ncbi:hypothetical protein FACS1894208_00770 [Clostridia bacterium]|nr:hypothetical protein FACS1894208_00770 [Clostridia bacterium]
MRIYVVTGKAGHGKDAVTEFITRWSCERVTRVGFVDSLKAACRSWLGWDGNKDEKGRRLLQRVGTDLCRKTHPTILIDFLTHFIDATREYFETLAICDARFPNEIAAIKAIPDADVTFFRVVRPSGFEGELTGDAASHSSETSLDDFTPDVTFVNDADLAQLERKVIRYLFEQNLLARQGESVGLYEVFHALVDGCSPALKSEMSSKLTEYIRAKDGKLRVREYAAKRVNFWDDKGREALLTDPWGVGFTQAIHGMPVARSGGKGYTEVCLLLDPLDSERIGLLTLTAGE